MWNLPRGWRKETTAPFRELAMTLRYAAFGGGTTARPVSYRSRCRAAKGASMLDSTTEAGGRAKRRLWEERIAWVTTVRADG